MRTGGLPILTYHAFDTTRSVIATDPSWFAESLAMLHEAGFRAVDLDAWIGSGCPNVGRGYAITIDDGLRSVLRVADVIARYEVPATLFLVSDRIGSNNDWPGQPRRIPRASTLTWSELDHLFALGLRFASHGRTHIRFDHCDEDTLLDEVRGSREAIEQRLGRPCRLFAYPYGIVNARVRRRAAEHYAAAFGTRLDFARATSDRFQLPRVDALYLRSERSIERLISGRGSAWLSVRRTLREVRAAAVTIADAPRRSCRQARNQTGVAA